MIAILGAALAAVVIGLIVADIRGWLPHVSAWLITRSVRRLRDPERARWEEEQLADLETFGDRPLTGLLHAILAASNGRALARAAGGRARRPKLRLKRARGRLETLDRLSSAAAIAAVGGSAVTAGLTVYDVLGKNLKVEAADVYTRTGVVAAAVYSVLFVAFAWRTAVRGRRSGSSEDRDSH